MTLVSSTAHTYLCRWYARRREHLPPKIGFKTRYGMVENPFSQGTTQGNGTLTVNSNRYYRRVAVTNLM